MKNQLLPSRKLISTINMIPFTDVVLVLLVIFMITSPLLFQGDLKVNLPRVTTAVTPIPKTINITLTRSGRIYLNNQLMSQNQLISKLKAAIVRAQNSKKPMVVINADKTIAYGKVIKILDLIRHIGIVQVGIAVLPLQSTVSNNFLSKNKTRF
jgi:biopolymer transport protein TolR